MKKQIVYRGSLVLAMLLGVAIQVSAGEQWTAQKAQDWYGQKGWAAGCNFTPSTAINQLEMWQAETFDSATIDRELGWAQDIGFNAVRIFLHNIPWEEDKQGFLKRIDQFLTIADKHHIKVIMVPLDAVWDPYPKAGKQRDPKPHVHNSGWVQSPGVEILKNPARHDELKGYIQGVISHFKDDQRILAWDMFNEPDNMNRPAYEAAEPANKAQLSLMLLKKAFAWAREINPSQPLTAGVWMGNWELADKLLPMEKFCLEQSDVISFHNYGNLEDMKKCVQNLKRYHRPVVCTEYMARPQGSRFDPILGYLKEEKVGAINWGFVNGKTQTIYPWDTWTKNYTAAPKVWFHDIFQQDGTPYDAKEVAYIKSVTLKNEVSSAKR